MLVTKSNRQFETAHLITIFINMDWKYFNLKEFIKSKTAEKNNIDNTPDEMVIGNLDKLVKNILDPLRESFNHPIKITSGYRCNKLNILVGGVKNSQHLTGKAADIYPIGTSFEELVSFIKNWIKDKEFDQCIIEKKGKSNWIHISYNELNNRHKLFTIKK